MYIKSLFLIYDLKSLNGNFWKINPEFCSIMKNDFYTNIPLKYYAEFNKLIYPRIETGDNSLNQVKIKNVCNKMLKELIDNNSKFNYPKPLIIIDLDKEINPQKMVQYYIKKNVPFVIKNLDLEIFKLNFNQLNELVGNKDVLFSPSMPKCRKSYVGKFKEINSNNCYLSNITNIFDSNILSYNDVNKLQKLSGGKMDSKQLFVGKTKGTGTRLHSAFTNNFFINVEGKKTWTFFNPNNTPMLYPYFSESGVYNTSETRFLNYKVSNLDNFPLMKYVDYFEYTINPGEILYNPASWWHAVYNESETTFALSTRWTFPWIFMHNLDNYMLRCCNLRNKNLRNLTEKLYIEYNILGINVIDEHNILGNGNNEIPVWDKITNENHLLCYNQNCYKHWH